MVSIIVPVYKVEKYICRCVDSILNQTYYDFRLILVDDGSPDNCGSICDAYAQKDNRIVVIHKKNGGVSSARNAGLDWVYDNCNSEWITFVDSDDWVHPRYIEALLKAVYEHGSLISSVFLTSVRSNEEIKEHDYGCLNSTLEDMEDVYTCFGKEVACYAQGRLYSINLWKGIHFPDGKIFEDVDTMYKILLTTKKIALVHNDLYFYFANNEGIIGSSLKKWSPNSLDELTAYEGQLKDKRIKHNNRIYYILKEQYIDKVYRQRNQIHREDDNNKEILRFKHFLDRKLRKSLFLYSRNTKYDFKKKEYHYLYEELFPRYMCLYYSFLSLLN